MSIFTSAEKAAYNSVPRAIRMLERHGESALRPSLVNGRYIGPMVPRRKQNDLRKLSIKQGTFGSFSFPNGGWDPAWDECKKMFVMKPHRDHKHNRDRQERSDKIDSAMRAMPDRILKYKQEAVDRRPKKDILYMFKRIADMDAKKKGVTGNAPVAASAKASQKKDKK
mmetsp:Transcript_32544/g.31023  ORF Transcript_32544/g.31023 Transcript_32544/m.31023 type:complete len:168 (+) Transcript_32544:233-736(+)|eukprot:CAMPEP_0119042352 /NCGR_PEP_ID=MMETSP1177-20130426/14716_1 /TAXON_ID=2985 /ORGANISM="Ochromonas sp, Strain CCMP1899" /LENGTH=167 /DNA_ID=CAMNT_0007009087 /DNA_START=216 /DNA_END=719 /DNA_ORIENTATION=-